MPPINPDRDKKVPPSSKMTIYRSEDKVEIAINLFDLDRLDQRLRSQLLAGRLDLKRPIVMDKNLEDEVAVAFCCNILAAACICDSIRAHDRRAEDSPTRVYIRRTGNWTKVAREAQLTIVIDDRSILNPKLFKVSVQINPAAPKRIDL